MNQAVKELIKRGQFAQKIMSDFPIFPSLENYKIPKNKIQGLSIGERCCGSFLTLLFPDHKFVKIRPTWLKNPETNRSLELDFFCEDLMIAVEYNGSQHYVYPNPFNKSEEEFINQQKRDKIKEGICKEKNICLIRVPYLVPYEKIPFAIYGALLDGIPEMNKYFFDE